MASNDLITTMNDDFSLLNIKPELNTKITEADIRSEFSHHDPTISRINNGSFGCCPATILAAQRRWQVVFLRHPDAFYCNHRLPAIDASRRLLLPLINATHLHQITLLDNASTAVAIVLQSISRAFADGRFNHGDAVVMLDCAYPGFKNSVRAYVSRIGGIIVEAPLPFPVYNNDHIVSQFRDTLHRAINVEKKRVRLAILDHITCWPCVVLPIKELVRVCRAEGVDKVFVDGAHGIGCINLDMEEIGADFYTSTLHKWFFCPPSIAFLYCKNKDILDDLHHPIVSFDYGQGLPLESSWVGTRDYSAQLVVPHVLDFVNRFEGGIHGIMQRNHEKVVEMAEMLVKAWGTHLGCLPDMCASMIMVGLPACLGIYSDNDALKFRTLLREKFCVDVMLYFRPPKDGEVDFLTGYARISHQVYNTVDDYYKFRDVINKLVQDGFSCKQLNY